MQKTDPLNYYEKRVAVHEEVLSGVRKQLFISSMLRLTAFLLLIFVIYFFYAKTNTLIITVLVVLGLFLFLISRHTNLQHKRDKLLALILINKTEIAVQKREFLQQPDGREFLNPAHFFSQDIDLFGRGSFYQYSNRTSLQQGKELYAEMMIANSIENIQEKQLAVKELSALPEWREDFSATASLINTETSHKNIVKWMQQYAAFLPSLSKFLPLVFSLVSVAVIGSYFLDWISGWVLGAWFFLGLAITGKYLKQISKLASDCNKIQSTFQQYQSLIWKLEQTTFTSQLLNNKKAAIIKQGEKTSKIMKKFSGLLNALDQRNNIIIGVLGNAFMLRDVQLSYSIEQWIAANGAKVERWFAAIAFFDAFNTLGNFAFNHPNYTYPKIEDGPVVLKSENAAHPMLDPEKSVENDFEIREEEFFIITGANMAGKSTFLRTVALQIMMANIGLPVCASATIYCPIKLITSMRTTDSLTDDESYFFSELKRLKFIVDQIGNERYFVVLDEILKGTNSIDKAKGSRKFLERLAGTKSTGLIATHDLSLCEAAEESSEIKNYYFDAEIIDNELHFDYKFKEGVCQNMNASFLLKKMGIVN
ncbi:MAG: DNA mismatch repair protein MutS [Flavobacteriaceae bacterium]